MTSRTMIEFDNYIKFFWNLTSIKPNTIPIEILLYKRNGWYCNISGELIPELQNYNRSQEVFLKNEECHFEGNINDFVDEHLEYEIKSRKECLAMKYYNNGYNSFRIFNCGHCFIDIYLLSCIFDHTKYSRTIANCKELLNKCLYNCLFGCNENTNTATKEFKVSLYEINNCYDNGTLVLRNTIPSNRFKYVVNELEIGDIIDTYGYRGKGIYIYEGNNRFLRVPNFYQYPIWPIEYLKLRGYSYYIKKYEFLSVEILRFENDLVLFLTNELIDKENKSEYICESRFASYNNLKDIKNYQNGNNNIIMNMTEIGQYIIYNNDPLNIIIEIPNENTNPQITIRSIILKRNNINEPFEIHYPFINCYYANLFLKTGLYMKARLNDNEELRFKNGLVYIYDNNSGGSKICIEN